MSARLVVVAGPSEGQVYILPENAKITIGRGDRAEFRVQDPTVSRAHCVIQYTGGRAVIKDNGSSAGTKINNKSISTIHELKPGDNICLGDTRLRFQSTESGEEEAPPEAEE